MEQRTNVIYLETNCTSLVKDLGKDFSALLWTLPVFHDSFCFVWRPNPPYAAQHHLFYLPVSLLLLHFNPRAPYSLRIPFPKAHSKPRFWVKGEVVDCERRLVYRAKQCKTVNPPKPDILSSEGKVFLSKRGKVM